MVLWYFWIYSFLGYLLEKLFAKVTRAEQQGRKCFLLLPLCPVYGLGMLAVLVLPESWMRGGLAVLSGGLAATAPFQAKKTELKNEQLLEYQAFACGFECAVRGGEMDRADGVAACFHVEVGILDFEAVLALNAC